MAPNVLLLAKIKIFYSLKIDASSYMKPYRNKNDNVAWMKRLRCAESSLMELSANICVISKI